MSVEQQRWQGAKVGEDSTTVAVRVTEEEKERLERMRREFGLTSKGQVIRKALDVMEILATPGTFMMEGPAGVRKSWEEHPEFVNAVLRRFGLLDPELEAAGGGSPAGGATSSDLNTEEGTKDGES